ncbi:MAG: (2Fe-2S)-binding protein [Anaerolineae bacterium]|nr:(2Fe-2S)-binding protein [Anaerolineae bacterium]
MSLHPVTLTINQQIFQCTVNGSMTLLELLRDELHFTGVKDGCAEGDCGACTVIYNGAAVKSCLILAAQADGAEIISIEGLSSPDGELHPIQSAFIQSGAVQCGYCTPGMVLVTKALLDANPNPTYREIQTALSGNLCRCTGYAKIFKAVQLAATLIKDSQAIHAPVEIISHD